MKYLRLLSFMLPLWCLYLHTSCTRTPSSHTTEEDAALEHARQTLDSLYSHYAVAGTCLLREEYPSGIKEIATSQELENSPRQYSYLWPYTSTFAAVNALLEATSDSAYRTLLADKVLVGLEAYFDTERTPAGYASYIPIHPRPDRYYDDNCWVGLEFTNLYLLTHDPKYLKKSLTIWKFIESGMDSKLGGGIYWCEQRKDGKNTCSNAPAAVLALKLFQATKDSTFFRKGEQLYQWVKSHLQDTTDYLYFDNIYMDSQIGKAKYAYNSGQMMQAASLLYRYTHDATYLADAQKIGQSCYNYFFTDYISEDGERFRMIKLGDIWFTAVMLRGFIELYRQDSDGTYLDTFRKDLDYAWKHARDDNGLFNMDLTGRFQDSRKSLHTQAAMAEMYARLATIKDSHVRP